MAKYQNQLVVAIDKKQSTKYFATYGKPEISDACKVLNGSGFKVWCYLLSNSDGALWNLSPSHAEKVWGIPSSTFHDGMKELREKGFIEDGIVHQQSIYEESEIRKTKRKSNDSEIRIYSHTEFGEEWEKWICNL